MNWHAPNGLKGTRRLAMASALALGLCPASAWALIVPPVQVQADAQTCPVGAAALPLATPSKSEAILGGTRSKLEELRAQQNAAMEPPAMLASAAGPTSFPVAPCAAVSFAKLPELVALDQPAAQLAPIDVSKPDVFGSVALAVNHTPLDSKWQRAQRSALSVRSGPWRGLVGEARGLDQAAKIESVNSWVNARTRFVDDIVRFRTADRWATAAETLRAGEGDCEDYAIAKMKLLEAAGVARSDMFLVIAKDLVRRADHALLVVRSGDRLVVLDNNTDRIVDAAAISDYRPVMSYSAGKAWLHGYAATPVIAEPAPVRIAALSVPVEPQTAP
jgi:predicted transglutaminase-like cysteine proteinase